MSQWTGGIYRLTQLSHFYTGFQSLLGSREGIRKLVEGYVAVHNVDRVLDLGCGPAQLLEHLPQYSKYIGIDYNQDHISRAHRTFRDRGTFHCGDFSEILEKTDYDFDMVLCFGFFHHLDDERVHEICRLASSVLKSNGKLVAVDPAFEVRQHIVARALAKADSGRRVRQPDAYRELVADTFSQVRTDVRHDILKVPYTHCITTATKS